MENQMSDSEYCISLIPSSLPFTHTTELHTFLGALKHKI